MWGVLNKGKGISTTTAAAARTKKSGKLTTAESIHHEWARVQIYSEETLLHIGKARGVRRTHHTRSGDIDLRHPHQNGGQTSTDVPGLLSQMMGNPPDREVAVDRIDEFRSRKLRRDTHAKETGDTRWGSHHHLHPQDLFLGSF